jgi:ABC-2 type transport system ATP-binding protein
LGIRGKVVSKEIHGLVVLKVEKVFEISKVSKVFKNGRGIQDIHFSLKQGDVMGVIGPNGAGKTTMMKCITGLLRPDSGQITIFGKNVEKDYKNAMKNVGAYIGPGTVYPHLTAYQNLKQRLRFYPELSNERIFEVLEQVGLLENKHEKASSFSMGMSQRLGLAVALLSKPQLVILDEPANGLDIDGMLLFRRTVEELSSRGVTFIISSHLTKELDEICSHFGIMQEGKLIFMGSKESLGNGRPIEEIYIEKMGGDLYAAKR